VPVDAALGERIRADRPAPFARLVGAGFSDIDVGKPGACEPRRNGRSRLAAADIDTGLRLRYEFSRNFAPYIGLVYEGNFGQTASYAKRVGESAGDFRFNLWRAHLVLRAPSMRSFLVSFAVAIALVVIGGRSSFIRVFSMLPRAIRIGR
jgi:hypothetical protein